VSAGEQRVGGHAGKGQAKTDPSFAFTGHTGDDGESYLKNKEYEPVYGDEGFPWGNNGEASGKPDAVQLRTTCASCARQGEAVTH
jgi:hypothetical protein